MDAPAHAEDLPRSTAVTNPWQRAAYDDWVARLGLDRMDAVLRALRDQLRGLLHSTFGTDRPVVRRLAHDAASTAGMLGFLDVTRCCRAMLEAGTEDEESSARTILQHALDLALGCLDRHFMARNAEARFA